MRHCLPIVLLALVGCPKSAPTPDSLAKTEVVDAPVANDVVALTYGWKAGDAAIVTTTESSETTTGPSTTLEEGFDRTRIDVVAGDAEGLVVAWTTEKTSFQKTVDGEEANDPAMLAAVEAMREIDLAYQIGVNGEFMGLVDAEGLFAHVEAALDQMVAAEVAAGRDPEDAARLREVVGSVLSPEVITYTMMDSWASWVTFWVGGELEVGPLYEMVSETVHPLTGDPVPLTMQFGITGWLPCHASDPAPRCVEVVLKSEPDPDAIQAVSMKYLEQLSVQMGVEAPDVSLVDVSSSTVIVIVTEPETLRPWHVTRQQKVNSAAMSPDGLLVVTRKQVGRETVIEWE